MQSALRMVADESKFLTCYKLFKNPMKQMNLSRCDYQMYANLTVECMPMQLSEATEPAKRILHTYFSTWHELRQAEICVYKLQNFPKKTMIYQ